MTATTAKSAYRTGVIDGLPFVFVAIPFAVLFGVVATEAGLPLSQVMGFSVMVIAGAAQFAALNMMVHDASILLIVLAALAVNLRMAMYSASLAPWLGKAPLWQRAFVAYLNFDQTYMMSTARYEEQPDWDVPTRIGFFFGVATPLTISWITATLVGVQIGAALPDWLALDFALPITFIALAAPMMRTLPHLVAAGVAAILGLALAGLPSGVGLLIAAAAAMGAGAATEIWMERT